MKKEKKRWGLASIVDLTLYRNKRKKRWVLAQLWIWFDMKYEEKQRKKRGLRASCGFGLLYDSI